MKWCVVSMLVAGLAVAGSPARTIVGVVHDNHCVGPNCATQCPINKSPVYTLQSGESDGYAAYILSTAKPPAQYVGRKVVVTGTLVAANKIKVTSIAPAR
ncbi:MAG TPA: hypothetical protein VG297_11660 [Bryobacteraceae bacterium]|jgi:hypothetical protein|nr:hypothetical protein [Bryobacteraceae bacterium]